MVDGKASPRRHGGTEESEEPHLGNAIPEVVAKVKSLLEWMPICSEGSSGYIRRVEVEKAIENLEAAWGLARL
jgi:hypothetical protein